jgi:hypothetical protein
MMDIKKLTFALMTGATLMAAQQVLAAPTLLNGSFEAQVLSPGQRPDIPTGIIPTGWTYTGAGAQLSTNVFAPAQDGNNYIIFGGNGANTSVLTTSVTGLTAGQTYRLGFYLTVQQVPGGVALETLGFSVGSTSGVATISGTGVNWVAQAADFVADSSTATIIFSDRVDANDVSFNLGLDNVTVTQVGGPVNVPLPGSVALLLPALLGLGLLRKQK